MKRIGLYFALLALVAGLLGACHPDPVHEDAVKAQGPEDPGIPTGPFHRSGQPCLVCHADRGPASMVMSFAGTLYWDTNSRIPVANAIVTVTDSKGHVSKTASNCVGNFFIQKKAFNPVWPAWVQVSYNGSAIPMASPIFRDGSCADCHHDPAGPSSAGHIFAGGLGNPPAGGCK